ncbi:MAG: phytoene desaturase family protein [Acidimicrobiales bacterium]
MTGRAGGEYDAVVVGSGPNGLAAAVVLSSAGLKVLVAEGAPSPGGGCRTAPLSLPGFIHDVCSAAHPLAVASPFFTRFDLASRGVRLLEPEVQYCQPLDGGRAAAVVRSVESTAASLGADARAYRNVYAGLVEHADALVEAILSSLRTVPRQPGAAVGFGLRSVLPASALVRRFHSEEARALFGGASAHSMIRLDRPPSAAVGLFLGMLAHAHGWPVVEGGSGRIVQAMVEAIERRGGVVATGTWVRSLGDLPPARAILLDVGPRALVAIAGHLLPARYRRALVRFRYGDGVCKVDFALSAPVPWAAEACRRSATLHLGGTFEEVARSEAEVAAGRHPGAPYVLVVQPGVVDRSRAPDGRQSLWSYCHVPAGSTVDMAPRIARQIERFAPGFRDLVLAQQVTTAADEERGNPNYVGGDIASGAQTVRQTLARPLPRWNPYRTPIPGVYLCSASTPPGPGVHGRCGELAALLALREVFGVREPPDLAPDAGPPGRARSMSRERRDGR